jgi:hypothetical protein
VGIQCEYHLVGIQMKTSSLTHASLSGIVIWQTLHGGFRLFNSEEKYVADSTVMPGMVEKQRQDEEHTTDSDDKKSVSYEERR